jgi:hypothetical protein
VFIRKTARAFTTIKLIHVFAISLVIGSIAIVDSRLLGLASTRRPFAELARGLLPAPRRTSGSLVSDESMIPKSGYRFAKKIMLQQQARAGWR